MQLFRSPCHTVTHLSRTGKDLWQLKARLQHDAERTHEVLQDSCALPELSNLKNWVFAASSVSDPDYQLERIICGESCLQTATSFWDKSISLWQSILGCSSILKRREDTWWARNTPHKIDHRRTSRLTLSGSRPQIFSHQIRQTSTKCTIAKKVYTNCWELPRGKPMLALDPWAETSASPYQTIFTTCRTLS